MAPVAALLTLASPVAGAPTASDFATLWQDDIGSTNVTSIAQDHTGFLWLSTQGGLVRYDGYDFVVFRADPEDPSSLDDSFVTTVFVDSAGTIWAGTQAGVCRYEPDADRFVRYASPEEIGRRRFGTTEILEHEGRYIVGAEHGVFQIDPEAGRIEPYPGRSSGDWRLGLVSTLLSARDGTLWVGSTMGLSSQSHPGAPFERRLAPIGEDAVVDLFEHGSGEIWVRWANGSLDVVEPGGETRPLRARSAELAGLASSRQTFLRASAEEIWLGTNDGIVALDASTGERSSSVSFGTPVYALFADESGTVWAGVTGQGLARYVPASSSFRLKRDGLAVSSVNAAAEVDGRIWIGTRGGGIYIWRPEDDELRHVDISGMTDEPNAGFVRDILPLGDSVWVATNLAGVIRFDRRGNHRGSFGTSDGLPGLHVFSLEPLSEHEILVGTTVSGLGLIDTRRGTAGVAPFFNGGFETPRPPPALDLAVVGDTVYVGGDGLWEVSRDGSRRRHFAYDPADPASLSHSGVMTLLVDSRQRLWVGTRGGLNLLQRGADGAVSFRRFGMAEGLENPFVDGLLEGTDGGIWAATGSGLSRLDPDSFRVDIYDYHDGVPKTGFWVGGHARTADGTMMFASKQGLLLVDPEVAPWTYQPRLAVTAVRVDGRARPEASRTGLTLASEERGFSVEFAALDLSSPNANRYSFRLEGYDEHWTATTAARRVATYTNLDPGEYLLRVRGTNRVGRWSPDEIALPIVVEPGPLETVWFRGLVVLAVPCVLYLTHWWRIRRLRAREVELQRLVRQRTEDLEEANRRLELSSRTDLLTGLPNRRGFEEAAEAEIRRWRRSKRPLCIALCDLDDFKAVNDSCGHDAGDHVLRSFATLLQDHLRDSDTAARWGGEEFILLFPETDLAGARTVSEKLERRIAGTPWRFQGEALKVTVTIGIAQLLDEAGLDDCITRADKALYAGKRAGKSRVVAAG